MQVLLPLLYIVSIQSDLFDLIFKKYFLSHMFSEKDSIWLICVDVSSVCRLAAPTTVALHWPSSPMCLQEENCPILIQPEWELLSLKGGLCGMGCTLMRADILQNCPIMVQLLGVDGWLLISQVMVEFDLDCYAFHSSNVAMLKIASSPMSVISMVQKTLSIVLLQYCAVWNTLKHWTLWLRSVYLPQMLVFCFTAHVKSTNAAKYAFVIMNDY